MFVAACTDSRVPRRQARAKETRRRDDQEARVGCAQGVGKTLSIMPYSQYSEPSRHAIVILSAQNIMASNLVILFMETFEKVISCEIMLSLSECVDLLFVHLFQVHDVQS